MNSDPIKVIWKYKNENRRTQYNTYIFVGNMRDDIMKILEKIKNMNLFTMFTSLSKQEYEKMEKVYGNFWYKKFYNMYHIYYTINLIQESSGQKKILANIYGNNWLKDHIDEHKLSTKKLFYNYEALLKEEFTRKNKKVSQIPVQDELDADYRTYSNEDVKKIFKLDKHARETTGINISDEKFNKLFSSSNSESSSETNDKFTELDSKSTNNSSDNNLLYTTEDTIEDTTEYATEDTTEDTTEYATEDTTENNFRKNLTVKDDSNNDSESFSITKLIKEDSKFDVDESQEDYSKGEEQNGGKMGCKSCGKKYKVDKKLNFNINVSSHGEINLHQDSCKGCGGLFYCSGCEKGYKCGNNKIQKGGEYDEGEIINDNYVDTDDKEDDDDDDENNDDYGSAKDIIEPETFDEIALDDINDIYKEYDVEIDKNAETTSNLIKKALRDEEMMENSKKILEFDASNDGSMYDEKLKDIYKKIYITHQYVYRDDTIKTVKEKICCSVKNNKKFGEDSYLLPSRQYMWGEYLFEEKIQKVMIGQKWRKQNELLSIDVEPNANVRYYEELRDNLKLLRDNIKRYGNRIKYEDDDTNILEEYNDYITGNEIYMIDIYNELGKGYNPSSEVFKNIYEVYIKLYFNKIKNDDFKNIVDYLNNMGKVEVNKMVSSQTSLNNDLLMTNEIMQTVDSILEKKKEYKHMFGDNFITHSVVHVSLGIVGKIDLYRIFNNFENTDKYPFIQYQTLDGMLYFKFKESNMLKYIKDKNNAEIFGKWFENAPYGISFKVKIVDKGVERYTAINLNEYGRIEYKTQWKEEDMATIEDIKDTYVYVNDILGKINRENKSMKLNIPHESQYKYAFINSIQKFTLPEKYNINHNDLSEFSRYFFPYVSLIIEPRKRQAKVVKNDQHSKFGTYLRYKRISKYDNQQKMEQRIMYFLKNYEHNDKTLVNEIGKQFNITEQKAAEEIDKVKKKYPNIKLSRKILKKMENIPKCKLPGIGIEIQGKHRENYKMRISGSRDYEQLTKITNFMNVLMFLYIETYLQKKPERQELKKKLLELSHIAKRRNKVEEIVIHEIETKNIKHMTQLDKQRIGFKPEKGQNQWTRSCQNSGTDKKRRPQQFNSMEELIKAGFILNKKTGEFERKAFVTKHGKKIEKTVKSVKLKNVDLEGNVLANEIHYACGPEENGEHMYVGFLTRSNNPNGHCMPCCFKKDPFDSKNTSKKNFNNNCLENKADKSIVTIDSQQIRSVADKLYVLQDTNKIQDGRIGFMSKYMDFYFNTMLNNTKKIKNHYLTKTETGYYFKFGTFQDEFPFMNAVASIYDMTFEKLLNKVIESLENDKKDQIFTSLNNGDIKTQFETREKFINYIKKDSTLDYSLINSLLSIPNVLHKHGVNIVIFQKNVIVMKSAFEREKVREDFYLVPQKDENKNNIIDPKRQTIFIINENKNYYPIVKVIKKTDSNKDIQFVKTFNWQKSTDTESNIVDHISDLYTRNFYDNLINKAISAYNVNETAREIYEKLQKMDDKKYSPICQYVDIRNKCKYIITQNNFIIPIIPSGSIYNLPITQTLEKYVGTFEETLKNIEMFTSKYKGDFSLVPKGVYVDDVKDNSHRVIGITFQANINIPIKAQYVSTKDIKKLNLIVENKTLYDKIDENIKKGKNHHVVDERITIVNKNKYVTEGYELFRLELSNYINKISNDALKNKLLEIVTDKKINKTEKAQHIKLYLYNIIDDHLYDLFKSTITMVEPNIKTSGKKMINLAKNIPNVQTYKTSNIRTTCDQHTNAIDCTANTHCNWANASKICKMAIPKDILITYVNKVGEELTENDLKAWEILQINNYFVSDIVDKTRFTEKADQRIISSHTVKKILGELFNRENVPTIGRHKTKIAEINYAQMNSDNHPVTIGNMILQKIIHNNLTLFRACSNAYYWMIHPYYDSESRNIGYYSMVQTDLANYFKSLVIDWVQEDENLEILKKDLSHYMKDGKNVNTFVNEFVVRIGTEPAMVSNCIFELYILNKVQHIPIVVYNDNFEILYIFDDGLLYNSIVPNKNGNLQQKILEKYGKNAEKKDIITLQFILPTQNDKPFSILAIYDTK